MKRVFTLVAIAGLSLPMFGCAGGSAPAPKTTEPKAPATDNTPAPTEPAPAPTEEKK
jgi:hypothetical protein